MVSDRIILINPQVPQPKKPPLPSISSAKSFLRDSRPDDNPTLAAVFCSSDSNGNSPSSQPGEETSGGSISSGFIGWFIKLAKDSRSSPISSCRSSNI